MKFTIVNIVKRDTTFIMFCFFYQTSAAYYCQLRVMNNAHSTTEVMSKPIIVYELDPTPGRVKDGTNFKHDITWQSSNTSLTGNHYIQLSQTIKNTNYIRMLHHVSPCSVV